MLHQKKQFSAEHAKMNSTAVFISPLNNYGSYSMNYCTNPASLYNSHLGFSPRILKSQQVLLQLEIFTTRLSGENVG